MNKKVCLIFSLSSVDRENIFHVGFDWVTPVVAGSLVGFWGLEGISCTFLCLPPHTPGQTCQECLSLSSSWSFAGSLWNIFFTSLLLLSINSENIQSSLFIFMWTSIVFRHNSYVLPVLPRKSQNSAIFTCVCLAYVIENWISCG